MIIDIKWNLKKNQWNIEDIDAVGVFYSPGRQGGTSVVGIKK